MRQSRNTEPRWTQSIESHYFSVNSVPPCFKPSAKLEQALNANLRGLGYGGR